MAVFEQDTPLELIVALRPDVLVKGGDYREETIVGASRGRIVGRPRRTSCRSPPGQSTTSDHRASSVATLKSDPRASAARTDALRPITLERHAAPYAEGSCLVERSVTRACSARRAWRTAFPAGAAGAARGG